MRAIAAFFAGSQLMILHLPRREVLRIAAGLLYTYVGLALFLTGVNVGFMPMGNYLGQALAGMERRWLLVPLGMLMGYFVVSAEPAVHVLSRQVYELTAGAEPVGGRIGIGGAGDAAHPDRRAHSVAAGAGLCRGACADALRAADFYLHRL